MKIWNNLFRGFILIILLTSIVLTPRTISIAAEDDVTVDILMELQGGGRPDPGGWEIPVTVKFFTPRYYLHFVVSFIST